MKNRNEFDNPFYIKLIRKHPPFDRNRELEVTRKAHKGNRQAQEQLVLHNLGLVISVARKFMGRGVQLDDLIQEGNIGLLKTIEHFDPETGNRFSTYAVWWIRSYILRSLKDGPSSVRRTMPNGGLPPRDISLEEPLDSNSERTRMEQLPDEGPPPDEQLAREEASAQLRFQLDKVRGRIGELGWDIINERLMPDEPRTLAEIGTDWDLSRERVRQVEKETKKFLGRYLGGLDPNNQDGVAPAKKVGGK